MLGNSAVALVEVPHSLQRPKVCGGSIAEVSHSKVLFREPQWPMSGPADLDLVVYIRPLRMVLYAFLLGLSRNSIHESLNKDANGASVRGAAIYKKKNRVISAFHRNLR